MADMLVIPDDMVITLWHSFEEFTLTPVGEILKTPTKIEARYEGKLGFERDMPDPLIRFSFTWNNRLAGRSFSDINHMAAKIASHLAAMSGEWPGTAACVYLLPVVDFSVMYEASAVPRSVKSPLAPPAHLMEALARSGFGGTDA